MKPNYILVPIEWVDSTFDSIARIPTSVRGDDSNGKLRILNRVKEFPQVDLSEEGINEKSMEAAVQKSKDGSFVDAFIYSDAYQQCAKDLLNTK